MSDGTTPSRPRTGTSLLETPCEGEIIIHIMKKTYRSIGIIAFACALAIFPSAPLLHAEDAPLVPDAPPPAAETPAPPTTEQQITTNDPSDLPPSPPEETGTAGGLGLATSSTPLIDGVATTTATTTGDIVLSGTNDATSTTSVEATASTGGNTASTTATTTIVTGDAYAEGHVINVVNVNIFDSDVLIALLNRFGGSNGSVDLRNSVFGFDGYLGCAECTVIASSSASSSPQSLTSSTTDTATVGSALIVRSSTGDNVASSTGTAAISTGNAYAAGTAITMANSTLVDSHYLMLVLNNYGGWGGDLVLPTASFFDRFLNPAPLLGGSGLPGADISLQGSSTADVQNVVSADAQTGDNVASTTGADAGTAIIQTGSSNSGATVINEVNGNHIGGSSVALIFHIFGNWSGRAFNVPSGFIRRDTPDGIELIAASAAADLGGVPSFGSGNQLSLGASSTATIGSYVDVSASTGGNSASGSAASVSTGNAYAAANVINVANTTTVGRNWLAAIVNVFGDWNGNLSFGQPDLWVGGSATSDAFIGPGDFVSYGFVVKNRGDAPAHNVRLAQQLGSNMISFMDGSRVAEEDVGTLQPGETREIKRIALISADLPYGKTAVSSWATASADESDTDLSDNTDVVSVVASRSGSGSSGGYHPPGYSRFPLFALSKTHHATSSPLVASSSVDYAIHIVNNGNDSGRAVLVDEIVDPAGAIMHSESWDLDIVHAREDITLTYSAFFSASTSPGIYVNRARIRAADGSFADSEIASSSIEIEAPPAAFISPSSGMSAWIATTTISSGLSSRRIAATSTFALPAFLAFTLPGPDGYSIPPDRHSGLLAAAGELTSHVWYLYLFVLLFLLAVFTGVYDRYARQNQMPLEAGDKTFTGISPPSV